LVQLALEWTLWLALSAAIAAALALLIVTAVDKSRR